MQDVSKTINDAQNMLNKEDQYQDAKNEHEIKEVLLNESLSCINKAESQHSLSIDKHSDFLHDNQPKVSANEHTNSQHISEKLMVTAINGQLDFPSKFNFHEFMTSQENFEESFLNTLFKLKYGELSVKQTNINDQLKGLNLDTRSIATPNEYYYVNSEDSKNYIQDFLIKYNKIEMKSKAGGASKLPKLKSNLDFDKNKRKCHLQSNPKVITKQIAEQERKIRHENNERKPIINTPKHQASVSNKITYNQSPTSTRTKVPKFQFIHQKKNELFDLKTSRVMKPRSNSSLQVRSKIMKSSISLVNPSKRNRSITNKTAKSKLLSSRSIKKKIEIVVIDLFSNEGTMQPANPGECSNSNKGANEFELHNFNSNSIGELYNNTQYTINSNLDQDKAHIKSKAKPILTIFESKNFASYQSISKLNSKRVSNCKFNSSGKNYIHELKQLKLPRNNNKAKSHASINIYLKSQINTIYYTKMKLKNNILSSFSLSPQATVKDNETKKIYSLTHKDKFNSVKAKHCSYSDILKNFCCSNKNFLQKSHRLFKRESLTETSLIRTSPRIRQFSPLDKASVSFQIKKYYNKNIQKDSIFNLRVSPLPFNFRYRSDSVVQNKRLISRSEGRKS